MSAKRVDVLLAMSSSTLLALTEKALLREGLSVQTATDGIETVLTAFSVKPRIIICSQILPGMDGLKVSRFLSTVFPEKAMPVIISVPDRNPQLDRKAFSASAVAVISYSTPFPEIRGLLDKHMSLLRSSLVKTGLPVSRDRILHMVADSLEDSLEALEVVINLVHELAGTTSISAACRKVVVAVLNGLGFQRVWIGLLNKTKTEFEVVAYRGRGITGKSIVLSESTAHLPVDRVFSEGKQTASWHFDFQDNRDAWAGCIYYVDTPVVVNNEVIGIIRCDNGITKTKASNYSLRILCMLADEFSAVVKNFFMQENLYNNNKTFDSVLAQLSTQAIIFNKQGVVNSSFGEKIYNKHSEFNFVGSQLTEVLSTLPEDIGAPLATAVEDNMDTYLNSKRLSDKLFADFSLIHNDSDVILLSTDKTEKALLQEKIRKLEFETDAIASLATDLSSLMDVQEICRTMLRTIKAFYPEEAIAILVAKESVFSIVPDELVVYALSEQFSKDCGVQVGVSIELSKSENESSLIVEVAKSGRLVNVSDVTQAKDFIRILPGIRSELILPMISRGRLVGVLDLESSEFSRFDQDDIRRLNNIIGFASGVLETALQQTELIHLARSDRLTGLYNMTFFEERYPEEFERAERYEYSFSVIMMDIDDFKHYNDSFGHPMGNVLLQKITRAMKSALRDVDILVRYGGEEFVCILPLTDNQLAAEIAERIRKSVLDANEVIPNSSKQPRGCVSLSLGVATFPGDSLEKDELLEIADQRMYRAKRAGKNRVCSN